MSATRSNASCTSIKPPSTACSASTDCGGTRSCSTRLSARPWNPVPSIPLAWLRNPWRALISSVTPPCPMVIVVVLCPEALQIRLWITGGHRTDCDATKKNGRLEGARPCTTWRRGLRGLGLDNDLDRQFDVGVQVHDDLGLSDHADRAFAHHHFRLLDRRTQPGQGIGDLARADRAVQLALGGSVGVDGDAGALELGAARVGVAQLGLRLGFVLGAARLELGDVGGGGRHGLALRHEEVAAVTRLDVD